MHWPWAADESFFIMCAYIQNYHFILQCLPGGNPQGTYEEANKEENKEKNRYPNILPCEYTFCSVFWVTPTSFLSHVSHASNTLVSLATVDSSEEFVCAFAMKWFHHKSFFTMHHSLGFFKLFFTLNKWFEFHGNMFICFQGKSYHLF